MLTSPGCNNITGVPGFSLKTHSQQLLHQVLFRMDVKWFSLGCVEMVENNNMFWQFYQCLFLFPHFYALSMVTELLKKKSCIVISCNCAVICFFAICFVLKNVLHCRVKGLADSMEGKEFSRAHSINLLLCVGLYMFGVWLYGPLVADILFCGLFYLVLHHYSMLKGVFLCLTFTLSL